MSQEILPDFNLYTLEGIKLSTQRIVNDSMPTIMVFWKTYDDKCCNELVDLNDVFVGKLKDKGVRVVAVCVDNTGNMDQVRTFIYGHDIEFDVYFDKNEEFMRAMSIPTVPFTILFDKYTQPYCKYLGYCPAIDEMLCKKVEESLALRVE